MKAFFKGLGWATVAVLALVVIFGIMVAVRLLAIVICVLLGVAFIGLLVDNWKSKGT